MSFLKKLFDKKTENKITAPLHQKSPSEQYIEDNIEHFLNGDIGYLPDAYQIFAYNNPVLQLKVVQKLYEIMETFQPTDILNTKLCYLTEHLWIGH